MISVPLPRRRYSVGPVSRRYLLIAAVIAANCWSTSLLLAHEGHRPLPTRGMEVDSASGKMILTRSARETLDVQTAEVVTHALSQNVTAYGTLVSPWGRQALVSSPLGGRITELLVSPGEIVRAGQPLAELDSPDLELLQLELKSAQTELNLSSKLVASMEQASRSGAIAEIRFIEAQSKVQQDRAALEIARAKWVALRLPADQLEAILKGSEQLHPPRLILKSPIDGTVTHSDLSVGKVVDPKEHLCEVLDLRQIWLKIGVLEKDLAAVAVGQSFDFLPTAFPGEVIRGQIEVLGRHVDPQSHLGTIWATLDNDPASEPRLLPGMSGQVLIKIGGGEKKLAIPLSAVIRDGAERFVLVEEEQTKAASAYQKQTVVLGRRTGSLIEVRGGRLLPGDRVVTRGSHELGGFFAKGVLLVSPETAQDIELSVKPVSPESLAETITIDGVVDLPPTRRTVAASQLSGAIQHIRVDRGQQVEQGQILAEVVSQEFQNLQLELLRAELDISLQATALKSLRTAGDAVPLRRLWEAESQLNQSTNRRDTTIQRLKTAGLTDEQLAELISNKTLLAALPVRAPIAGVVTSFDKVLGHVVRADEPMFEIQDVSQIWIQGFVSERDLPQIHIGQTVRVRFVADPTEAVAGTLVRSGRALGLDDHTLAVWIELKTMPRIPIHHNMSARITVETARLSLALAVPRGAVIREGTRSYVFVQKPDETFERQLVEVGHADDNSIEVRRGLMKGDLVAVRGAAALQTGYAALR